jgi:hypothetical protein
MPSRRVPVDLNAGTWFVTLTVQRWYYLFDRHNRWSILADSIRYCQEHKGLELNEHEWVRVMRKHPELIERPIIVRNHKAVIGRPIENIEELL